MKPSLPALQQLRERVEALGLPGVIGIGLLVFTLMMYAAHVAPLSDEVAAQRDQAGRLQRLDARAPTPRDRAAQVGAFYASFPPQPAAPEWLAKFESAASANGVQLTSGEYKLERNAGDRLLRYRIVFPVSGTYEQLRGFVGTALQDIPPAALDEVNVRREDVGSATLQARLRFTLFLRPPV